MFFETRSHAGFLGKAAFFALGAMAGAAAVEAAMMCMNPAHQRMVMRKGRRLYRMVKMAAERAL